MINAKFRYESILVEDFALSNNTEITCILRAFEEWWFFSNTFLESESAVPSPNRAAHFSKFFHSVFNKKLWLTPVQGLNLPDKLFCSIAFNELDTSNALCSNQPSKAFGPDGIPPNVLKYSAKGL